MRAFIASLDGHAMGFAQYYDASKVGGGWWENEKPGVFGIDLFIGDSTLVGRGLGASFVNAFLAFVKERELDLQQFIIDPDPVNRRAIRTFEKAGFAREAEIVTPGGPALLMRRQP